MTQHTRHSRHHGGGDAHHEESGLADMLDLDAEIFGSYLDEAVDWVGRHAPDLPRR